MSMKRGNFGRIGVFGEDGIFSLKENYASQTSSSGGGGGGVPAGYEYQRGWAITIGTLYTATPQGNGDYIITGTGVINSSSSPQRSDIFTVEMNPYIEVKYGADGVWSGGAYAMLGFINGTAGHGSTTGLGAMIYYNGNMYPGAIASGLGSHANGDILQFGFDMTTRTAYVSKNDSATVYTQVVTGTEAISFQLGSGSSSGTAMDFLAYGKDNVNYLDSFIAKTGVNFTPIGWAV